MSSFKLHETMSQEPERRETAEAVRNIFLISEAKSSSLQKGVKSQAMTGLYGGM